MTRPLANAGVAMALQDLSGIGDQGVSRRTRLRPLSDGSEVSGAADSHPLRGRRSSSSGSLPQEDSTAEREYRAWSDTEAEVPGLVGSLVWSLAKGDSWVLGPESAFLFRDCWRRMIVREAYMLATPVPRSRMWRDALKTLGRRWMSGEPLLLDLYTAEADGAQLGISSDEIGGSLYAVTVDRGPLISRKTVYFGSQPDAMLRLTSPLEKFRRARTREERWQVSKRAAYGPGWIYQMFIPREGTCPQVILQIDGDVYFRDLEANESIRTDPRHAYAWDATVSYRLVKFGHIADRLLRGSVPFQVEFEGPGRLWLSNISFSDGYLGSVLTPSHWIFRIQEAVRNLLGYLNPARWF